jgi:ubiquinone/menaquinone biosynthesis C-methylase UbiE
MAERFRKQALREFDKWSKGYDRPGFFQRNLFIPTQDCIVAEMERRETAETSFAFLDIGCGTGTLVMRLHEEFPKATMVGADISPGMIEVATAKAAGTPGVSFQVGNASTGLSFPDSHFEYVSCCHSFHHYHDQAFAVREFRRLLKPNGKLLFVDSDINSIWGFLMHCCIIGTYEKFGVWHRWSRGLRNFFERHGLRVDRQERRGGCVPWLLTVAVAAK